MLPTHVMRVGHSGRFNVFFFDLQEVGIPHSQIQRLKLIITAVLHSLKTPHLIIRCDFVNANWTCYFIYSLTGDNQDCQEFFAYRISTYTLMTENPETLVVKVSNTINECFRNSPSLAMHQIVSSAQCNEELNGVNLDVSRYRHETTEFRAINPNPGRTIRRCPDKYNNETANKINDTTCKYFSKSMND